jgi:hypothetical protein
MDSKNKGTGNTMRIIKFIAIGFAVLFVIGAIAEGSKNTKAQPTSAAPAVANTAPAAVPQTQEQAPPAEATVNPIWTAESTSACEHEDKATGRLSASCVFTMREVCATPIDEAASEIMSLEEELKENACKMEVLATAQNSVQEGGSE